MDQSRPPQKIVEPSERFAYVKPSDAQLTRLAVARSVFTQATAMLADTCPPGRYSSLMLTALEEAAMWASKAITHESQP